MIREFGEDFVKSDEFKTWMNSAVEGLKIPPHGIYYIDDFSIAEQYYTDILSSLRGAFKKQQNAAMAAEKPIVVVADDEPQVLLFNKDFLESLGFNVLTAANPDELIKVMAEHGEKVSLLLTDTTGWIPDVKRVKEEVMSKFQRDIPTVAISGLHGKEDWEKAGVPINTFLSKPYTLQEMIDSVNSILPMNPAMKAGVTKAQNTDLKGGIDLNSVNLNLQIKRDGKGVPLPLAKQDMDQLMKIQGFVPIIIEIKPAVNLPILGELQQKLQSA